VAIFGTETVGYQSQSHSKRRLNLFRYVAGFWKTVLEAFTSGRFHPDYSVFTSD